MSGQSSPDEGAGSVGTCEVFCSARIRKTSKHEIPRSGQAVLADQVTYVH